MPFKRHQFVASTAAGAQSVSGVGFAPEGFIVTSAMCLTDDGTVYAHMDGCLGVALDDGSAQSIAWGLEDAVPTTNTARGAGATAITLQRIVDPNLIDAQATVSSWDSDGFTLNWAGGTGALDSAWLIEVLVWAGVDAALVSVTQDNTLNDLTISGLSFTPKVAIAYSATPPGGATAVLPFGIAVDGAPVKQSAGTWRDGDNSATTTVQEQRSNDHIWRNINATPTVTGALSIQSFDAGGVTINQDVAAAGGVIFFLLLGGAGLQASLDRFPARTTTGSTPVTGPGFTPQALFGYSLGWSGSPAAGGAVTNTLHIQFCMGLADANGQAALVNTSRDGVADAETQRSHAEGSFIRTLDVASGATVSDGLIQSFDANGYTIGWPTSIGAANEIIVLALSAPAGSTPVNGAAVDFIWDTAGAVDSAAQDLVWDARGAVDGGAQDIVWDTPASVNSGVQDIVWDTRGAIDASSQDLVWDTAGSVTQAAQDIVWDTRGVVAGGEQRLIWDLDGPAGPAAVNGPVVDLVWDTRGEVAGAVQDIVWDTRGAVMSPAYDLVWDTYTIVVPAEQDIRWDTAGGVNQADRMLRWDLRSVVNGAASILKWDTGGTAVPLIATVTDSAERAVKVTDAAERVITLTDELE